MMSAVSSDSFRLFLVSFAIGTVLTMLACREPLPSSSSSSTSAGLQGSTTSAASSSSETSSPTAAELVGFTCDDLEEVRMRFSDPGFIRNNEVAVYAAFLGAPGGDKFLRIYWDYRERPETFQIVDTQEGEVRRNDDSLFDIEAVVEHTYENIREETRRTIRVELIHEEGNTRLCARSRDLTLRPAPTGAGLLEADNGLGIGESYSYSPSDSVRQRALKACESHYGAGNCCVLTGGYQNMQYGLCGAGGFASINWHWDNHPAGHCGPVYVVGDVLSAFCGTIEGSFIN